MFEGVSGLLSNISSVFTLYHMMILGVGVMGGLILGALPGISPTLSVALLVPLTFHMEPSSGLILLGSVYMASVAGGAISAILINVPGAPANVATMLDGYPMTKSGRSQEALYTCFISSFIGGVFGMLVMILLTTPLAEFALRFRSGEIFWVSVLGLTVVAGLGGGNLPKALIAGAFGVLLSTVGPNPTTGEFRFIFHDVLTGGVNIIAALIGLFAIPQVLSEIESFGKARSGVKTEVKSGLLRETFLKTICMFRAQGIGSVVGSVVGLVPGIGGQVAGIVAYDQSKKISKNSQAYGHGTAEGIAAAESANNAMVGPSLVPLLTLSIPGSPTAAVLLGGLLIHGIFPGPNLFLLHGDIVHTFIGSLLVAQFVMLVFGLFLSRHSSWVAKVPSHYMAAAIVVLAIFGTYSINNNFNDLIVMFCVGVMMFFGSKIGFSATPVVMGLILGTIAEDSFLKGMMLAEAGEGMLRYFFTGNIKLVVIFLCATSLVFGLLSSLKQNRKKDQFYKKDLIVPVVVLAASLLVYNFGLSVSNPLSSYFPQITIIFIMILSLILIFQESILLFGKIKKSERDDGLYAVDNYPYLKILFSIIMSVAYISLLDVLGFYISSFLYFLVFLLIFDPFKKNFLHKFHVKFSVALVFIATLFSLFNFLLKVSMPYGVLF